MKFKTCTSFLLAVLILVSNIGLVLNVHFCGGQIAAVTIKSSIENPNKATSSCCDATEKDTNCCHNKTLKFQKKSDFASIKSFAFKTTYYIAPTLCAINFYETQVGYHTVQQTSFYCNSNAPPLWKLHHQFIFYG